MVKISELSEGSVILSSSFYSGLSAYRVTRITKTTVLAVRTVPPGDGKDVRFRSKELYSMHLSDSEVGKRALLEYDIGKAESRLAKAVNALPRTEETLGKLKSAIELLSRKDGSDG